MKKKPKAFFFKVHKNINGNIKKKNKKKPVL